MDHLRPLTRRLAELLATDEGAVVLAQLQKLALGAARRGPQFADGARLGIWDAVPHQSGAIEFVRSQDASQEWRYWADVERIPSKSGRRVVLIGESVARGYLFDPALTPARLLESALGCEVVDLARTDLTAGELPQLFDALPALEPDAVVLFAGNNWHNLVFEIEDLQRLADAVRTGGFGAMRAAFLELVGERARLTLTAIAESVDGLGAPLCVVVPEFNLRDWRPEHGRAEGETREALEAARDAVVGLMIAHSPRCPAVVQDALRGAARERGWLLVDLPRVFGGPPGREHFLDYCHLTVEGMRVAMGAVAGALGGGAPLDAIAPEDEAAGHLLAAVHNAHYGQPDEILRHHVDRALTLAPAAAEDARALLELLSREAEPWLCAAHERLSGRPAVRRYLGPEVLRLGRLADFRLCSILAEVADARDELAELLAHEHAEGPVDLLDPRYRAETFRERGDYRLGPERAFHQALTPRSRFYLVRTDPGPVRCRLTLRGSETVTFRINGDVVRDLPVGAGWLTHEVMAPARSGVNVVELEWSPPEPDGHAHERAAWRLERGIYPDVLAAFGEVHAFTAS